MNDTTKEKPLNVMQIRSNPHPLAALFPKLEGQEFIELVNSIRTNGLLEPIMLDKEHRIIDGINRLEACMAAKVEPIFATYEGHNIASFILARNIARRHLSASQRALLAARLQKIASSETPEQEWSVSEIARTANVSRRTAKEALEIVEQEDTDAQDEIMAGERSVFTGKTADKKHEAETVIGNDTKTAKSSIVEEMQQALDALLEENKRLEELVDPEIERKLRSYEETIERQQQEITSLNELVSSLKRENNKLKKALESIV